MRFKWERRNMRSKRERRNMRSKREHRKNAADKPKLNKRARQLLDYVFDHKQQYVIQILHCGAEFKNRLQILLDIESAATVTPLELDALEFVLAYQKTVADTILDRSSGIKDNVAENAEVTMIFHGMPDDSESDDEGFGDDYNDDACLRDDDTNPT